MRGRFLWAFLISLLAFSVPAYADTLQEQIDDTPAGGTLKLFNRSYMETAVIKKPITIVGGGGTQLMADSTKPIFTIKNTRDVTLKNMSFLQSTTAIIVKNGENVQLEGIEMIRMFSGVQVYDSKNVHIEGLTLRGIDGQFASKGYGLAMFKSENITLQHNDVTSVQDAYYLEHTKNVKVNDNVATDSRYGLHFMYADGIEATNNKLENNVTGVMLMLAKNAVLRHNDVRKQWNWQSSGFTLYNAENITVEHNTFDGNRTGILSQTLKQARISHNVFTSNQTAIEFTSADQQNSVTHNDFTGNILNIRSDGSDTTIDHNYYDDYSGTDIDGDGIGDTTYSSLQSFGQWMVRKPSYQYFVESPAVVMLNEMDQQTNRIEKNQLVDASPVMEAKETTKEARHIHIWSLLIGLIMLGGAIYLYRKGVQH